MQKLRSLALVIAAAGSMFTLSACGSSCGHLPAASQKDMQAVADGYEVEREGKYDAECELQPNGTWRVDD